VYKKARPIFVACLFGIAAVVDQDQAEQLKAEADGVILDQYRQDPFFKLPPGYSNEVSDRWTQVYFENGDEIKQLKDARIADQKALEAQAAALEKAREDYIRALENQARWENFIDTRSRVVAAIPFGVGQFQNDEAGWGAFFAASEGLFALSAIISWGIAESIKNTKCPDQQIDAATNELREVDCDALLTQFDVARAINYISLGMTGGLAITGIIQAQVVFQPERNQPRKRPLPGVKPELNVSPQGFTAGVTVHF
jgi:hypothetical protein